MSWTNYCLYCSMPFEVRSASRLERSKYCSHSCRQKYRIEYGDLKNQDLTKLRKPTGTKDDFKEKDCEYCFNSYKPTSSKQRWCIECAPDESARALLQRYGITFSDRDELIERQGNKCALCSGDPRVVDHDHRTGKIRGILCYSCNLKLSALEDKEWLKRAEEYCHSVRQ